MANALRILCRYPGPALATGVLLGFALPDLAALLQKTLPVMAVVFTTALLLRIDKAALAQTLRRPLPLALLIAWSSLAVPLFAVAVIVAMPISGGLRDALLLWAIAPPMMAAPAFALLLRLDAAAALFVSVAATLMVPITALATALVVGSADVSIDAIPLVLKLCFFVVCSILAASIFRRALGAEFFRRRSDEVSGVLVLLLLIFAISIMAGFQEQLRQNYERVLLFVAIAFASNLALQLLSAIAFAWAGGMQAGSAALLTGNRNMSIVYAYAGGATATPDVMLFFTVVHLPIYTLPWLLRRLYWLAARDCAQSTDERPSETPKMTLSRPKPME